MVVNNKVILFLLIFLLLPAVYGAEPVAVKIDSMNSLYYNYRDNIELDFFVINEEECFTFDDTNMNCSLFLFPEYGPNSNYSLDFNNTWYVNINTSHIKNPTNFNYLLKCCDLRSPSSTLSFTYSSGFTINDNGKEEELNIFTLTIFIISIIFMLGLTGWYVTGKMEDNQIVDNKMVGIKLLTIGLSITELVTLLYLIYAYVYDKSFLTIIGVHNKILIVIGIFAIILIGFLTIYTLMNFSSEEKEQDDYKKWQ